jgi:hypothetical protein
MKDDQIEIGSGSLCNGMDWEQPYAALIISIMESMESASEIEACQKVFCWSDLVLDLSFLTDPAIELCDRHLVHELLGYVEESEYEGGPGMSDTFIRVSIDRNDQDDVLSQLQILAKRFSEWIDEMGGADEER